jgi:hypothetical protein
MLLQLDIGFPNVANVTKLISYNAGSSVFINGFSVRRQPGFLPRRPVTAVGTLDITTNIDLNNATITRAPPLKDAQSPQCDFTTLSQVPRGNTRQIPPVAPFIQPHRCRNPQSVSGKLAIARQCMDGQNQLCLAEPVYCNNQL